MSAVVHIEYLECTAPVQGEGTVAGERFYLRARWQHWTMGIGGDPVEAPKWRRERQYGTGESDASYMPRSEAEVFIRGCAADFLAGKTP